jgi:hypothetical protein
MNSVRTSPMASAPRARARAAPSALRTLARSDTATPSAVRTGCPAFGRGHATGTRGSSGGTLRTLPRAPSSRTKSPSRRAAAAAASAITAGMPRASSASMACENGAPAVTTTPAGRASGGNDGESSTTMASVAYRSWLTGPCTSPGTNGIAAIVCMAPAQAAPCRCGRALTKNGGRGRARDLCVRATGAGRISGQRTEGSRVGVISNGLLPSIGIPRGWPMDAAYDKSLVALARRHPIGILLMLARRFRVARSSGTPVSPASRPHGFLQSSIQ